jgi:hypothetical protein
MPGVTICVSDETIVWSCQFVGPFGKCVWSELRVKGPGALAAGDAVARQHERGHGILQGASAVRMQRRARDEAGAKPPRTQA